MFSLSNHRSHENKLPPLKVESTMVSEVVEVSCEDKSGTPRLPDGGYGWVVAVAIMVSYAITWGINTTFGVYASFLLEHNYFPGGTPLRYGFVGGLSVAVALVSAPLWTYLAKRFDFRVPFVFATVAVVLGQCSAGICKSFATFLVCQGLLFGLGLGAVLVSTQNILASWFDHRLSLALGIANAGSGIGGLVLANTTRILIEHLGLRTSLIINGAIAGAILIPVIFLLRKGPAHTDRSSEPLQLRWLVHPGFVWVCIWGFLAMMAYFLVMYTLASYATDGIGLSQAEGAALQSLFCAGLVVGRLGIGSILDLGGRINTTIILHILAGVSCWALWLPARSFALLAVFAIFNGCMGGSLWSTAAPVASRVVGSAHMVSALTIFWLSVALPAAVASPCAIALLEYSRNALGKQGADAYAISIAFGGSLFALSGLCLYGAKVDVQKSFKIFQIA